MSKDNESAAPSVDENTLKTNEIARAIIGTGATLDGFHVDFRNGVATLSGRANSEEERKRVLDAARGVAGVSSVNDTMQIGGSAGTTSRGGSATAGTGRSYTVQAGDTLTKIAKEHYGDASEFKRIFEANRNVLSDADKIQAGQVLTIPD